MCPAGCFIGKFAARHLLRTIFKDTSILLLSTNNKCTLNTICVPQIISWIESRRDVVCRIWYALLLWLPALCRVIQTETGIIQIETCLHSGSTLIRKKCSTQQGSILTPLYFIILIDDVFM